jgi:hypothetical protein
MLPVPLLSSLPPPQEAMAMTTLTKASRWMNRVQIMFAFHRPQVQWERKF